jgi:zinc transport system permease protein
MNQMLEMFELPFMQNALLAALLASLACGVVGCLVVINRIVFISGGIAHTAYGGIGLAFYLGISPFLGAVGYALAAALLMAWISLKDKARADTIIGVLWAVGMALGILFLDLTPGYRQDLMSYLFGSILTVPVSDLYLTAALDLLVLGVVGWFYPQFLALSYDEEYAATRGLPVRALYYLMIVLISLVVVMLIRVVGLILVIALLTIPPYIAESFCRSLKSMMAWASLLCGLFTLSGLWLSYHLDLTSGAAIILVAGGFFFLSLPFRKRLMRERGSA